MVNISLPLYATYPAHEEISFFHPTPTFFKNQKPERRKPINYDQ